MDPSEVYKRMTESNKTFTEITGIPLDKPEIEPPAEVMNSALGMRAIFVSYVNVGFNEEQAMRMLLAFIGSLE